MSRQYLPDLSCFFLNLKVDSFSLTDRDNTFRKRHALKLDLKVVHDFQVGNLSNGPFLIPCVTYLKIKHVHINSGFRLA